VVEKIKEIAREEMNSVSGQEMSMTSLQKKEVWECTDRWSDKNVDIWFKSKLKNGTEIGFAWSHEEPITEMMKMFITSYKDLPIYAYQFQIKLRNELRSKSGIMRGREFLMKDLYSYSKSKDEHDSFYTSMIDAYMRFYNRVGLGKNTYVTVATGGVFTKNISHEFQTICDAGEDVIYIDKEKNIAYNEEAIESEDDKVGLEKHITSEVGNIFSFGTEKCEKMGLVFMDTDGIQKPVYLGSYGIGITRVMGVIVEKYSDDKGLVWPKVIAPYLIEIVSLHKDVDDNTYIQSEKIYNSLNEKYEVLFDDRLLGIMPKLFDADLYGMPIQIIIGEKTLDKGQAQIKNRQTGEVFDVLLADISKKVEEIINNLF
jgi:prolyl-tRNA synthetase